MSDQDPPSPQNVGSKPSQSDVLNFPIEIQEEGNNSSGWWPVLKRSGIFFEYILPTSQPLQMPSLIASFLLMVTHQYTQMSESLASASLLDKIIAGSNLQQPFKNLLILMAVNVILPYLYQNLRNGFKLHKTKTLSISVYAKILSMDPAFHSATNPTALTNAMDNSKPFLDLFDSIIFSHIIQLVGIIIAANSLIRRHGLFLLAIILFQATLCTVLHVKGVQKRSQAKLSAMKMQLYHKHFRHDSLSGWATLFNYNLVEKEIHRYKSIMGSVIDQQRTLDLSRLHLIVFQSLARFCGIAIGYSIIIFQYHQGTVTFADLVFFISVWQKLWFEFRDFTGSILELVDAVLDIAPLQRILEKSSVSARQTKSKSLKCCNGNLRLVNVSFAYPGLDKPVINGLDVIFRPATKVAVMGPSGVGKTTLSWSTVKIFKTWTRLREQGGSLSGGEKQRIELARLFLKRPKIALLDEPTANLDEKTETQVLCNLFSQFSNATIIMVT
ncbi:hypothetical protein PspLS_11113, partial [Pyricularia sp. CBS 133598]